LTIGPNLIKVTKPKSALSKLISARSDATIARIMVRIWHDEQLSLAPIKGETIAVIGYGVQGSAQANNMRDSGLNVIVGLREGGKSWDKAKKDGHKVMTVSEAVKKADIVHILAPDMQQAKILQGGESPQTSARVPRSSFSHGAAIHWKWIVPPTEADVIMLAPKAPGQRVRELYLQNFGTPALVAVEKGLLGQGVGPDTGYGQGHRMLQGGYIGDDLQGGGRHRLVRRAGGICAEGSRTW